MTVDDVPWGYCRKNLEKDCQATDCKWLHVWWGRIKADIASGNLPTKQNLTELKKASAQKPKDSYRSAAHLAQASESKYDKPRPDNSSQEKPKCKKCGKLHHGACTQGPCTRCGRPHPTKECFAKWHVDDKARAKPITSPANAPMPQANVAEEDDSPGPMKARART